MPLVFFMESRPIKMSNFFSYVFLVVLTLSCSVCAETGVVTNRDHLSKAFQNAKRIGDNVYSIAGTKGQRRE